MKRLTLLLLLAGAASAASLPCANTPDLVNPDGIRLCDDAPGFGAKAILPATSFREVPVFWEDWRDGDVYDIVTLVSGDITTRSITLTGVAGLTVFTSRAEIEGYPQSSVGVGEQTTTVLDRWTPGDELRLRLRVSNTGAEYLSGCDTCNPGGQFHDWIAPTQQIVPEPGTAGTIGMVLCGVAVLIRRVRGRG